MDRLPYRLKALMAATALVTLPGPFAFAQETTTDAPLPPATAETPAPTLAAEAGTVLATVNGTEITLGLLHLVFTALPAQYQQLPGEVLLPALLDQAINQILLAQAGTAEGLDSAVAVRLAAVNAERDAIAGTFIQKLIESQVTEDAIRAEYDTRVAAMPEETEVNASHILVETEEKAKEVIATLEGGADFAETATANSTGPSGPAGGLLGWFGRGQMVAPFEEAVFALAAGQVSGPVQTQFGWHVIRVNETRIKPRPAYEEMKEALANEMSQALVRTRIESLRTAAEIVRPEGTVAPESVKDAGLLAD